jgi:hypothetical protein
VKRIFLCVLTVIGVATAALAGPVKYYAIEVRGGSRIFSVDPPVQKGRLMLFHRYPDGTYMSLTASEVEKVTSLEAAPPPPAAGELAPGQTVYVGPALSGPAFQLPPSSGPDAVVTAPSFSTDYGYGYGYWGDGGYIPPVPPGPVPPRVPSRIGPNGFPILAPPGTPGSVPNPIGANGFPIIAPMPPVAAPRRQ